MVGTARLPAEGGHKGMFIGHFAVRFAAKRYASRASLAVLLAAPLLSDLLWPLFYCWDGKPSGSIRARLPFVQGA
jgi:hypothetical protein